MLQFSLRSALLALTGIAVVCWALFSPPHWLGLLVIYSAYGMLPAAVFAGIVFHRGYWQAFFVGMAPWTFAGCLWFIFAAWEEGPEELLSIVIEGYDETDDWEFIVAKLYTCAPFVLFFASGMLGVLMRWWATSLRRGTTN